MSWDGVDQAIVVAIANELGRIADALERIANSLAVHNSPASKGFYPATLVPREGDRDDG